MASSLFFAIDPEEVAPELRAVRDYWNAKRGRRAMPRRADIDPAELRAHLAGLSLIDVVPDGADFRFRLLGTDITERFGRDSTGRLVSDVYADAPEIKRWSLRVFANIVTLKRSLLVRAPLSAVGKDFVVGETLYLPLSEDGERVDMILGRTRFIPPTG